ncbi:MAG: hypothetical protein M1812_002584 [Candelaria pacifica]|nr:MAG: hypothetical protein M1812_002584 [Candelaria pacifica]
MLLLDLPIELLQHVLCQMEPGTFFVSTFVCHAMLEAASSSKRILLHHLAAIPGIKLGLEDLSTKELFLCFRTRAARHLFGVDCLADVTRYCSGDRRMNVTSSIFNTEANHYQLAVVGQGGPSIGLYRLEGDNPTFETDLRPGLWDSNSEDCDMDAIKVAFAGNDITALFRYKPVPPEYCKRSPFVRDAIEKAKRTLKLVTFPRLRMSPEGTSYSSVDQETRDIFNEGSEPVGLAVDEEGTAAISWQSARDAEVTKICLYKRDHQLMEERNYDPCPRKYSFEDPRKDLVASKAADKSRLIFDMEFARQLNFFKPGTPIHLWSADVAKLEELGQIQTNSEHVQVDTGVRHLAVGVPFHGFHETFRGDNDLDYCRTRYLAIGINLGHHPAAYVVQAEQECLYLNCDHETDLQRGRGSSEWRPLALLRRYTQGKSSLGTVMAVSQQGRRIAMADWDRLLVWALEPETFQVGDPYDYQSGNFRRFYGCDEDDSILRIKPLRLPKQGVIHRLCFTGEDRLYAIADSGLMRWDVGPSCSNKRKFEPLGPPLVDSSPEPHRKPRLRNSRSCKS